MSIYRDSDNEFVPESQAGEVTITSKSDKRSRIEEDLFENVDVSLSANKRPKIIASERVDIIQKENNIKLIGMKKRILNIDKSQTENNSCKDINKLNKNDKIEEELPKDTDMVSFIGKQPKVVTSRCTEIVPSENTIESIEIISNENTIEPIEIVPSGNNIKLIEINNSIMDIDKSQEDEILCEKEGETGNILQEQCEIHYNKEEDQHIERDKIISSTTKNKAECECTTHVDTEEEKQFKENLISSTNETDKKVEDIFVQKFSETNKEIYKEMHDLKSQELINTQDSIDPIGGENNWLD